MTLIWIFRMFAFKCLFKLLAQREDIIAIIDYEDADGVVDGDNDEEEDDDDEEEEDEEDDDDEEEVHHRDGWQGKKTLLQHTSLTRTLSAVQQCSLNQFALSIEVE